MRLFVITIILALAAFGVQASEAITNMVSQCKCVMEGGECRVINRPAPKPGAKVYTSAGPIPAEAYNAIRQEGGLMCEAGREACTSSWGGDKCRAFRLMFRTEPIICVQPGIVAPR